MAQLLREIPEFHATINLVPSLLVQLQKYEEGHEDTHLRVSRLPADGLSADDMNYLLDNFFMVHPEHNIRPFSRYNELYEKRGLGVDSAARAAKRSPAATSSICNAGRIWLGFIRSPSSSIPT